MSRIDIKVTLEKLSRPELSGSPEDGAVVDFFGVVRGTEQGSPIAGIDYEAFTEMAKSEMRKIGQAASGKFSIDVVILHHRIGFVPAGEVSLFLRVEAAHRGPAFQASQWIVEQLKEQVPIWKHCHPKVSRPTSKF
jgi:molybdopterin synthase catalytic subunit